MGSNVAPFHQPGVESTLLGVWAPGSGAGGDSHTSPLSVSGPRMGLSGLNVPTAENRQTRLLEWCYFNGWRVEKCVTVHMCDTLGSLAKYKEVLGRGGS